ncbi:MAG: SDR family oxidoreductase [Gemmatimonadota bacterium]
MPNAEAHPLTTRRLLEGQAALVTGASSGIGRAIALAMAAAGAEVLVNYSSAEGPAMEVVAEIENGGGRAIPFKADVSREEDVLGMFARMLETFGTLDILVNNAGLQKDAPSHEMSLDQWNRVIGVNLTGQFLCAREAIREFRRRGPRPELSRALGKIVCVSSVHEVIPWAGHANYAASKGGVMLMMKTLAQEYAPQHIRINSVAPGAVRTPINRTAWETPEASADLMRLIPYKRIGEPEDIARTAVWLASDESDYITGTTLFVDGGMTLYPGFDSGG